MVPRPAPSKHVALHLGDHAAPSLDCTAPSAENNHAVQAATSLGPKGGLRAIAESNGGADYGDFTNGSYRSGEADSFDEPPGPRYKGFKQNGVIPFRRSDTDYVSHMSGTPSGGGIGAEAPESNFKTMLKRSASADSKMSKASTPQWARPVLRRSSTAESRKSAASAASSAPSNIGLCDLKEERSVKVTYEFPWCSSYEFVEKSGEGGFGQVWKCTHRESGESVAVKRIPAKENKDVQRVLRELKAFERFSNPYIVALREVFLDQEWLYMVMDLCTGGDLLQYLEEYEDDPDRLLRKSEFPEQIVGLPCGLIGFLMWQMLAGIAYMHHHRFCHRDIKLQNYVIKEKSDNPRLQLVDFGMAVRFQRDKPLTAVMGTMKYMAPEVLAGSYTEKCDLWSIGVVVYILCTERSPWGPKKTNQQMCKAILEGLRERWPACDKPKVLRSLVDTLMCRDAEKRPSAKQLLKESKWLQTYSRSPMGGRPGGGAPPQCCVVS